MSKLDDAAATMIANLEKKTGKTLAQWVAIVKASGLTKHNEIIKFLKSEHDFTHGYANMVSLEARKAGSRSQDDDVLVDNQYSGAKADLRPIYEAIVTKVKGFGKDVELAPKKAYVSLRRNKQFGLVQPSTRTRVDVGLNLSDVETTDRLEASGSFNTMVSHRVRLTSVDDVDDELIGWLKQAYDAS